MDGQVSAIQRYCVTDGYGIRTIVFLAGCTMHCLWCQNPESLSNAPRLMYVDNLCAGCGMCKIVCPLDMHGGEAATNWVKNYKNCEKCLKCADVCPYMALNVSSKIMSDEQVVKSVMKDEVFYRNTGGGITLSGGEPLLQADFSAEILSKIQAAGISTAIETAGFVTFAKIEKVLPYTDLFLYDIKAIDQGTHKKYTGVDNAQILRNVRKLARMGKEIIVRVPLIPGVNDGAEFTKIADFAKSLDTVQELHIMPFHNVGADKYRQMGLHYEMGDVKEDNEEKVEEARIYAESLGLRVSIGGSGY